MALTDTPWCGSTPDKLYLTSGQFTSTVKTSEAVGSIDSTIGSVSWDGTNTPWAGDQANKLYLTSGQFTSTVKTSEAVGGIDSTLFGISFNDTNTPWAGDQANKLYLTSGQFTSTIKDSEVVSGIDTVVRDISWDGTNTPWVGSQADKLYLQSGQFTSTVKTSEAIAVIDTSPFGGSWDGVNSLWSGQQADKLYLQSGQFTSTVKTSEYIGGINSGITGIETNDYLKRSGRSEVSIIFPVFTVQGGSGATEAITLPFLIVSAVDVPPATSTISLPMLTVAIRAYKGSAPECVVMNTKNFAVSEYINYGFNSMTEFNGEYLVADQNGIYKADTSDTDNAGVDDYAIKAHIKTGRIDIHQRNKNRLVNAWLNYQTDGSVQVVTRADKKATRIYMLPYNTALSGINERRVKFEKGIRNRFFDFKIQNIIGSQLEIDKLTIMLEPVVSKRR